MRRSGNKNGFTQIDHITFDLVLPLLSTSAQSIFLRIYRQTKGWGKQTDKIANSHFAEFCKIKNHETIKIAIDKLLALDVITVEGENTQIKEYGIKWDTLSLIRQKHIETLEGK